MTGVNKWTPKQMQTAKDMLVKYEKHLSDLKMLQADISQDDSTQKMFQQTITETEALVQRQRNLIVMYS